QVEVTVAELPAGEFVAGGRIHLHVDGEEVVAGMRPMLGDVVDEHLGVEALAQQPAVVVGKTYNDGLDLALGDEIAKRFDRKQAAWAGSVLTHLDSESIDKAPSVLPRHLRTHVACNPC